MDPGIDVSRLSGKGTKMDAPTRCEPISWGDIHMDIHMDTHMYIHMYIHMDIHMAPLWARCYIPMEPIPDPRSRFRIKKSVTFDWLSTSVQARIELLCVSQKNVHDAMVHPPSKK